MQIYNRNFPKIAMLLLSIKKSLPKKAIFASILILSSKRSIQH